MLSNGVYSYVYNTGNRLRQVTDGTFITEYLYPFRFSLGTVPLQLSTESELPGGHGPASLWHRVALPAARPTP